jgi:hypothetical protein
MGAGLCLIAAGTSPAISFAQQNNVDPAFQAALAAPLDSLKDAQDTYAKEMGIVSAMPGGSLAPREKAVAALRLIKSNLLQVINSGKIPRNLAGDSLNAINEAERALTTDGAQTIAYSLETVRQEVAAIQAKLAGQPEPKIVETSASGQPLPADKGPEQQPNTANTQVEKGLENRLLPQPLPDQAKQQAGKLQEQQIRTAQANQPSPSASGEVKERGEQPSQPAPSANAPSQSVANLRQDDVVGRYLFDNAGNDVAKIQSVKTGPDGKIQAVEIDVGGFLGIGARRVAVQADQLRLQGTHIEANLTSDQIRNLPTENK